VTLDLMVALAGMLRGRTGTRRTSHSCS
jgi:hypothetical protein